MPAGCGIPGWWQTKCLGDQACLAVCAPRPAIVAAKIFEERLNEAIMSAPQTNIGPGEVELAVRHAVPGMATSLAMGRIHSQAGMGLHDHPGGSCGRDF